MDQNQKWISRKFLIYKLLTNLWFVGAIWLYFYRLFITDRQVGVLDGLAFGIGLIAEVPSGVLADKFGRDKMVKLGQALAGSGILIQAFGSSFLPFVVGQAVMMIGVSFVSGADEALFFDKLQYKQTSADWRKLITRGSQIALIGSMTATLMGGLLQSVNPRIPWFLTGLSLIGSVAVVWSIKETRAADNKRKLGVELREHLENIISGFAEFGTKKLLLYVPLIITVQGLFYAAGWGLLRLVLLDRFHFSAFGGSVAIASSSLITVGFLALLHKNAEQISEKLILTLISTLAGISLILSIPNIGIWGFLVILVLYAGEHTLQTFMSEVVNYRTNEKQRATVLSVASFLRTMPYVILAPIIGYLNVQHKLEYFLIAWTLLIFMAVTFYLSHKKSDVKIRLSKDEVKEELRVPDLVVNE